jgi:hypothetical protein
MSPLRLRLLLASVLGFVALAAVAQAVAAGGPLRLTFVDNHLNYTPVGFAKGSTAPPPIGATALFSGRLYNGGAQFGKPSGTPVGRFALVCTVTSNPLDGFCVGIIHVPDGYVTIAGNGPFTPLAVRHYAVTGGIGRYATMRGEFTVTNLPNGSARSVLELSS